MKMSLNFSVSNINLGSSEEWMKLNACQELKKEYPGFQLSNLFSQIEKIKEFFCNKLEQEKNKAKVEKVNQAYQKLRLEQLNTLLDLYQGKDQEVGPAVICLENYDTTQVQSEEIKNLIEGRGYAIIIKNKIAFAYKKKEYNLLAPKAADGGEKGEMLEAGTAYYLDFEHQKTKQIVRVVTQTIKKFDSVKHKACEKKIKDLSPNMQCEALEGDAELELSLKTVSHVIPKGFFAKIYYFITRLFSRKKEVKPHIIIYIVKGNAAAEHTGRHANWHMHPQRLKLLDAYGYQTDLQDQNPTAIDPFDFCQRKVDYFYIKTLSSKAKVSIQSRVIMQFNDASILDQPNRMVSEHLPVISDIHYQSTK